MADVIGIDGNEPPSLPNNLEAEQGVLGAILANNRAFDQVADILKPEYFFDEFHGEIYATMMMNITAGRNADPVTLRNVPTPAGLGFTLSQYLGELLVNAPTVVNAKHYALLIRELAQKRDVITRARDLIENAYTPETSASDIESEAADLLDAVDAFTDGGGGGFVHIKQAAKEAIDAAVLAKETEGRSMGVATGIKVLDDVIGALPRGEITLLAARTAMGKTALAGTITLNAARRGESVAFFSLEMQRYMIANRLLSIQSGISGSRIRRGRVDDAELSRFTGSHPLLAALPIEIDDRGGVPAELIASRAMSRHRRGGARLIVIDYLGAISPSDHRNPSRVYQIERSLQVLKRLAKSLDVPILLLAQISRAVEGRENKRPTLADLRDSGAIEQEAGMVLMLFRAEYYLKLQPEPDTVEARADLDAKKVDARNKAEIIIAKDRHGESGPTVTCRFDAETSLFADFPASEPDPPGTPEFWNEPPDYHEDQY